MKSINLFICPGITMIVDRPWSTTISRRRHGWCKIKSFVGCKIIIYVSIEANLPILEAGRLPMENKGVTNGTNDTRT
jgi:hypothetical protein